MGDSASEADRQVDLLRRELGEAREQQVATSAILRAIAGSPTDIQPVFDTIAESAARLCKAQFCTVFRFDGELIHFVAQHGMSPDFVEAFRRAGPMAPGNASAAARSILNAAVEQIPDVEADPNYMLGGLAKTVTARSIVSVPMLRDGRPVGTINIARSQPGYFPDRQIELLRTFADQAVIAIENVRLFDEVQARNSDLSEALEQQVATSGILRAIAASPTDIQPVLNTVTESAAQLCDAFDAALFLRRGEALVVAAHHGAIPIDFAELPIARDLVTSRAVVDRVPVHVHDLTVAEDEFAPARELARRLGFRTILSTPLLREGEAIGALMIRRAEVRPFTAKQIELLRTFADQAVIAIENVRLFDEVQARNRDLSEALEQQIATSEILRVISTSPTDARPVFETIVRNAVSLCGSLFANVFRFDGELLHFVASHNVGAGYVELLQAKYPMRPDSSQVSGRVVLSKSVIRLEDAFADPHYDQRFPSARGWRKMLGVPMLREYGLVGVIVVGWAEPGPVSKTQEELLKTFADQAAIAIENVRLFDEVQARNLEVREALQQQTATADVLKVISRSAFDLHSVLQTLIDSACKLCGAEKGGIYMLEGEVYRLAANYGMTPELLAHEALHPNRIGRDSFVGRTALEKAIVHVPDVTKDLEYGLPDLPRIGGFAAILSVPLMRDGLPIGVFSMGRVAPGPFTNRQIELVQTFADQAVIAIENVRLFEEVQAKTRDLEESLAFQKATGEVLEAIGRSASKLQPVLDAIVGTAADLCRADMSVVRLMRDGALHHAASSKRNTSALDGLSREHPILPCDRSSVAGRVVLEGRTIHIPDAATDAEYTYLNPLGPSAVGAALGVPLFQDGKIAGVIILLRRLAEPFTNRQIELVQTFADQAVIAIENVRLFDEVQARTAEVSESLKQQTATADVLKAISRSTFDLQAVLDTLVESAAKLCDADKGVIFKRDGDLYRWSANYGNPPELEAFARAHPFVPGRYAITSRVALEAKTIHVTDVLADPEYGATQYQKLGGYRTILCVPILRQGEPVGVFALTRSEVEDFTPRQIELVETFADQAGIAIENVRLFEEVQARTAELSESLQQQTATADVLKVISRSTFDLQMVLDTLVESAVRLCRADKGSLERLIDGAFRYTATYGFPATFQAYADANPTQVGRGSAVGRAAEERRIVQIDDVLEDPDYKSAPTAEAGGFRTVLAVPLLREDELIGVFAMTRTEVLPFTDKEIELVKTFADQAVIAIENVRLFEEVQARTTELAESLQQQTATADVLKAISRSAFDLQTVLEALTRSAAELCGADESLIFLRQGDEFHAHASFGTRPEFLDFLKAHPRRRGQKSLVPRVAESGTVEHIPDTLLDKDYEFPGVAKFTDQRAMLGVPLLRDGQVEGVFVLSRYEPGAYSERQIEVLQTFADQAVIAIENARLFQAVQHRTDELSRSLDDLRTAQDRLIQTEKLASLGQLTAGIAHEIKNPLNFVNNFSSLSGELIEEMRELLKGAALDAKTRTAVEEVSEMLKGNLDKVVQHGKRADSIVKNMLLHSRAGSGEHWQVDINAVVEESLNLAYHGARAEGKGFNITLERNFDPAAGEVDLFPQEITRVLLNLISNGFYATVKRRAEADGMAYEPVLAATTRSLGDSVEIRIRDNGTGIPPEVKKKMFNPFFTTKPAGEGTGLGLSLSHDIIVKQHAGTIEVETEPGAFTEFRIVLPRGAASLGKSGSDG